LKVIPERQQCVLILHEVIQFATDAIAISATFDLIGESLQSNIQHDRNMNVNEFCEFVQPACILGADCYLKHIGDYNSPARKLLSDRAEFVKSASQVCIFSFVLFLSSILFVDSFRFFFDLLVVYM
jgi:hypothetical protein